MPATHRLVLGVDMASAMYMTANPAEDLRIKLAFDGASVLRLPLPALPGAPAVDHHPDRADRVRTRRLLRLRLWGPAFGSFCSSLPLRRLPPHGRRRRRSPRPTVGGLCSAGCCGSRSACAAWGTWA